MYSTDIGSEIDIAGDRIKELLATHEGQGFGFKLDTILDRQLHVANVRPDWGFQLYVPLPKYVQEQELLQLISKNVSDDNCFQYSDACIQSYNQQKIAERPDSIQEASHRTGHDGN